MNRLAIVTSLPVISFCARQTAHNECTRRESSEYFDVSLAATENILIVKYGGSAITVKSKLETLNQGSLESAAEQLRKVHHGGLWKDMVVIHGAGSFGHFHAKDYNLKHGGFDSNTDSRTTSLPWQQGLVLTRQSVLKLNKHVVDAHIAQSLPAVSLSPFPTVITGISDDQSRAKINTNGSQIVQNGSLGSLSRVLSAGLIPVLHGDVVLDDQQRCAILGGDHLIYWICKNRSLHSTDTNRIRVVFLTDVAGVYDRAPRMPDAVLITRINVLQDGTTDIVATTETAAHDVTGGIEAKIKAAVEIARLGRHVDVCIVQVGSESALQAMRGETPDFGTVIALQPEV